MKGDFSRWTYRRRKHYREVNMQQGRTQLDADWNEQNSINFHYERAALEDIIGTSGTPVDSATGYSDGFQLRFTNLLVTPARGTLSTPFTADGYGFAAGETVKLTLGDAKGAVLATATADSTGTFSTTITLPSSTSPARYIVVASGETSGDAANTAFELIANASILLAPTTGAPGQALTVKGYGFGVSEQVTFTIAPSVGAAPSQTGAGSDGSFTTTFTFPASTSPGTYTVTALGATSGDSATATFALVATSIELTPARGPPGQFTLNGYGFSTSGEQVTLAISPSAPVTLSPATAGTDGLFTAPFTFPASTSPGTYTITATGQSSGDTASTDLFILPYFPALDYTIKHGHYYVCGILCENELDVRAEHQVDLPLYQGTAGAIDPSNTLYLAYLDVWERHLTYFDDREIREVALLGPDTATRTKIVWQVKLLAVEKRKSEPANPPTSVTTGVAPGSVTDASALTEDAFAPALADTSLNASTLLPGLDNTIPTTGLGSVGTISPIVPDVDLCNFPYPAWNRLTAPSSGKLTARAQPTEPTGDPCEVPGEAGYTSLQNQLYRVEIHNGGVVGAAASRADDLAPVTFKWSRDNGVVVTTISNIDTSNSSGTVLTVATTGKNPNLSFQSNMWVEITSDINDLWGLPGSLALVTSVNDPTPNTITIDPDSVVGSAVTYEDYPQLHNPKVRRWDWDQTEPTPPNYPLPVEIPATNDGYIELEDGVQVRFTEGTYHTGDYWLIPARSATADVDWPEDVKLVNWASVAAGGSDATTLANFLIQRYGLDGIAASDFIMNGTAEIDASYTDPTGTAHFLSIALNDLQTSATLTVDGIVGAQIPVIMDSDGSLQLQCGFPAALGPEGIKHCYARLAVFGYSPTASRPVKPCPELTIVQPEGGNPDIGSLFVSISPASATVAPGGTVTATVTVSYSSLKVGAIIQASLSTSVQPTGPTALLSAVTVAPAQGSPATVQLNTSIPSGLATGCYYVQVTATAEEAAANLSNSAYLSILVASPFASPIVLLTDCRQLFPALIDLPRLFYVTGDGQTANANYTLPAPLMAAAWSGKVRFTIVKGSGTLTNANATAPPGAAAGSALDVTPGVGNPDTSTYTDLEHIAWCNWTIDQSTALQVVRAEQLDTDGNPTDASPIYYTACLPQTGQSGQVPSATTGLIQFVLQPDSAMQLGPFNHSLNVQVPPAILLGFELPQSKDFASTTEQDAMGDATNFILGLEPASASLSVPPIPIASVVDVNTQNFTVDVLSPPEQDFEYPSRWNLRWWAVPANQQAAQGVPGIVMSPYWAQAGATESQGYVQVEGYYFPASTANTIVTVSAAGATLGTSTIQADGTFAAPVTVPNTTSGWVTVTATAGSTSPSATFYVVSISLKQSGTFPKYTIIVSGTGFPPSGPVSVLLDGNQVQLSETVKTDATGSFAAARFTTPSTLTQGSHTVGASVLVPYATATFTAEPAGVAAKVEPSVASGTLEEPASRAKSSTAPTPPPAPKVAPTPPPAPKVAPTPPPAPKAAAAPSAAAPSAAAPSAAAPSATAARAKPSTPQLSLSIPTGPVGTDVVIRGTGFSPNSGVSLAFNQRILPEAMTNAAGSFITGFRVPQTASGSHTILARDETTGKTVSAIFKVP